MIYDRDSSLNAASAKPKRVRGRSPCPKWAFGAPRANLRLGDGGRIDCPARFGSWPRSVTDAATRAVRAGWREEPGVGGTVAGQSFGDRPVPSLRGDA